MQFFGGHEREAVIQIEAHLVSEYAQGAGAGAVVFACAALADVAQEIEILPQLCVRRTEMLPVGMRLRR